VLAVVVERGNLHGRNQSALLILIQLVQGGRIGQVDDARLGAVSACALSSELAKVRVVAEERLRVRHHVNVVNQIELKARECQVSSCSLSTCFCVRFGHYYII
jgi:hypothetical protein